MALLPTRSDNQALASCSNMQHLLCKIEQWNQVPTLYQLALQELDTKMKVIEAEWKMRDGYCPIEHTKTRIKEMNSVINKLERKGFDVSIENAITKIYDIAGMRIVCAFVNDIYMILEHLKTRHDLRIIEIKDYIANPKPNGYQSLHVIVQVPLILYEDTVWISVEIQLRTLAMDFWASMEHIIYYKYDKEVPPHVIQELTRVALAADDLDKKMYALRKEVQSYDVPALTEASAAAATDKEEDKPLTMRDLFLDMS
ncbi:GTP pyrophosphokinase [Paenibacillus selenitireducens]|uniref:GTP pyrophosphokinase n=1 Tax=Paenibacillus selenitireducens TaxID=1324314 RepID=A0A1T2X8E3_9BACL|nr:GTP pyrophosphokinase [Paenibacillus selenitireducens]